MSHSRYHTYDSNDVNNTILSSSGANKELMFQLTWTWVGFNEHHRDCAVIVKR